MERVSVITGKMPIIFVCPHGADVPALAQLTEEAAACVSGHAVINRGFRRGPKVNYSCEMADCNRIDHCLVENVVFEEFMKPIIKLKGRLKKKHPRVHVFVLTDIHGPVGMDVLVGFGNADDSITSCPRWAFELYVTAMKFVDLSVWVASPSGAYTASEAHCMNQLFRVYDYDKEVISLHIWVNDSLLRFTKSTAEAVAKAAVELTKHKSYSGKKPKVPLY